MCATRSPPAARGPEDRDRRRVSAQSQPSRLDQTECLPCTARARNATNAVDPNRGCTRLRVPLIAVANVCIAHPLLLMSRPRPLPPAHKNAACIRENTRKVLSALPRYQCPWHVWKIPWKAQVMTVGSVRPVIAARSEISSAMSAIGLTTSNACMARSPDGST